MSNDKIDLGINASAIEIKQENNKRFVIGTAYAGGVINYGAQKISIDLQTLQLNAGKIPLLHVHNVDQAVGFAELIILDNQLQIKGEMLDNEQAQEIISAADSGFPWQLSVRIEGETISQNEGDIVNGKTLPHNDVKVFKNGRIREVSFTPVGVDADTKAVILSLSTGSSSSPESLQLSALQEENQRLKKGLRELQLKDLHCSAELKEVLLSQQTSDELFTTLCAELKRNNQQEALLSKQYGETKPEIRKNPLLNK